MIFCENSISVHKLLDNESLLFFRQFLFQTRVRGRFLSYEGAPANHPPCLKPTNQHFATHAAGEKGDGDCMCLLFGSTIETTKSHLKVLRQIHKQKEGGPHAVFSNLQSKYFHSVSYGGLTNVAKVNHLCLILQKKK